MKSHRRLLLGFLIFFFFVLVGVLARTFLFENVILPVFGLILLIYRVLISIDQKIYWILFIFAILLYVFYRWMQQPSSDETRPVERNTIIMQRFNYWQTSLRLTKDEIDRPNNLRKDLIYMLVDVYTQQYDNLDTAEIKNGLRNGQIPLPYHIHSFLFPDQASLLLSTEISMQDRIWKTIGNEVKKFTGLKVKEYYQSIDEVLNYIESLLEKK